MKAKAKINLFLHITGKRQDNYHLLESMVTFAEDIYDEVSVSNADAISTLVHGNFAHQLNELSGPNSNIIVKAAKLLKGDHPKGAIINLKKNIPVAAGLGGGSADAAAAVKLLCKLWNINLDDKMLKDLCLKLGADVPACFNDKPAYMSGIGEVIEDISYIPALYALLVNPLISLSTKDVFENYRGNFSTNLTDKPFQFINFDNIIEFIAMQKNDLEESAIFKAPIIATILETLAKQDGCRIARMSGSGATCFGLFELKEQAYKAHQNITAAQPLWWTGVTRLTSLPAIN